MARLKPPRPWPVRKAVRWLAIGLLLLAAAGVLQSKAFSSGSTLKYGLTLAAPLCLLAATYLRRPLLLFGAMTIVGAPAIEASVHVSSTRISPVLPLLLLDVLLIQLEDRPDGRRGAALSWAAVLTLPLLAMPILQSSNSQPLVEAIFVCIVCGYVAFHMANDQAGAIVASIALVSMAALQGLIAVWSAKTGHQLNLYGTAGGSSFGAGYEYEYAGIARPSAMFNDPISLGDVMGIVPPIGITLLMAISGRRLRLAVACLFAAATAGLLVALDRTAWIGAVVGIAVMVALLPRGIRGRAARNVALGFVIVGVFSAVTLGSALTGKLEAIIHPTQTQGVTRQERGIAEGERMRYIFWHVAWVDGFLKHPLTGVGIGNANQLVIDHGPAAFTGATANVASTYLQLLAEGGVWALLVFVLVFATGTLDSIAAVRGSPLLGPGYVGAAVSLAICWVTDVVFYYTAVSACEGVMLGILAGLAANGRRTARQAPAAAGAQPQSAADLQRALLVGAGAGAGGGLATSGAER